MPSFVIRILLVLINPIVLGFQEDVRKVLWMWEKINNIFNGRDAAVIKYLNDLISNLGTLYDELTIEQTENSAYVETQEYITPSRTVKPHQPALWWSGFLYLSHWALFFYKHRGNIIGARAQKFIKSATQKTNFDEVPSFGFIKFVKNHLTLWRPLISRKSYNGVAQTKNKNMRR